MSVEAKDVLFCDDLEPGFDEESVLVEMQALVEGAGDWRDHIPLAAAQCYHDDADILIQYAEHVEACHYCQRLIEAVHPSDRLIENLQVIRKWVLEDESEERQELTASSRWQPFSIAAAFLKVLSQTGSVRVSVQRARINPEWPF